MALITNGGPRRCPPPPPPPPLTFSARMTERGTTTTTTSQQPLLRHHRPCSVLPPPPPMYHPTTDTTTARAAAAAAAAGPRATPHDDAVRIATPSPVPPTPTTARPMPVLMPRLLPAGPTKPPPPQPSVPGFGFATAARPLATAATTADGEVQGGTAGPAVVPASSGLAHAADEELWRRVRDGVVDFVATRGDGTTGASAASAAASPSVHNNNNGGIHDDDDAGAGETVRGVTMRPSGAWQAQVYFAGKTRYIGVFGSAPLAALAYKMVRDRLKKAKAKTAAPKRAAGAAAGANRKNQQANRKGMADRTKLGAKRRTPDDGATTAATLPMTDAGNRSAALPLKKRRMSSSSSSSSTTSSSTVSLSSFKTDSTCSFGIEFGGSNSSKSHIHLGIGNSNGGETVAVAADGNVGPPSHYAVPPPKKGTSPPPPTMTTTHNRTAQSASPHLYHHPHDHQQQQQPQQQHQQQQVPIFQLVSSAWQNPFRQLPQYLLQPQHQHFGTGPTDLDGTDHSRGRDAVTAGAGVSSVPMLLPAPGTVPVAHALSPCCWGGGSEPPHPVGSRGSGSSSTKGSQSAAPPLAQDPTTSNDDSNSNPHPLTLPNWEAAHESDFFLAPPQPPQQPPSSSSPLPSGGPVAPTPDRKTTPAAPPGKDPTAGGGENPSPKSEATQAADRQWQEIRRQVLAKVGRKMDGGKAGNGGDDADVAATAAGAAAQSSSLYTPLLTRAALDSDVLRGITMRPSGKWQAQMYFLGKSRYVGVFDTREQAAQTYELIRSAVKPPPKARSSSRKNVAP